VGDRETLANSTDFVAWSSSECPEAHELLYDVDYYKSAYYKANPKDYTFTSKITTETLYNPIPVSFQVPPSIGLVFVVTEKATDRDFGREQFEAWAPVQ
jgi:hypothetical protein